MLRLNYGNFKSSVKEEDFINLAEEKGLWKLVCSYREFFSLMESHCEHFKETKFYMFSHNDRIYAFKKTGDKDEKLKTSNLEFICCYEFENNNIKELFFKIFRMEQESGRMILSTISNYFNFLTVPCILNVIFRFENLKANNVNAYHTFTIPKKSGGQRNIVAPDGSLKKTPSQLPGETLLTHLRECNEIFQKSFDWKNSKFQVAYKKGKSVKNNADIHKEKNYVFNVDLKDFYPSCTRELVSNVLNKYFEKIFNGEVVKELFLDAILYNDALFIGSPISGCIANRIIADCAKSLKSLCVHGMDMEFSIYADDLCFSSDKPISGKFISDLLVNVLNQHGLDDVFKENKKKAHGGSFNRRKVTGVTINDSNKLTVSRFYYRELRAAFDHLSKGTFTGNLQKLKGKVAYATMIDETGKIVNLLKKYKTSVEQYKIVSKEKLKSLGV